MKNIHFNKKTKKFFEGWYLRHSTPGDTIAFIPGVQFDNNGGSAFIQVVMEGRSFVKRFDLKDCEFAKDRFFVRIGCNVFSETGVEVDLSEGGCSVRGKLIYGAFCAPLKNVMGIFSCVPFMECNHGVLSLWHEVGGNLLVNGKTVTFNGFGYIEKDWGRSFPVKYTWLHLQDENRNSAMISIARIPFLGFEFSGHTCVLFENGRQHRFATFNGSKVVENTPESVRIRRGAYELRAEIFPFGGVNLEAPKNGKMTRTICEDVRCRASVILLKRGEIMFNMQSDYAGFEYIAE